MERVPSNLLPPIFFQCLPEPCTDLSADEMEFTREDESPIAILRSILLTSQRWNAVAMAASFLWTDLNSSWARDTPKLLARSRDAKLSICWNTVDAIAEDLIPYLSTILTQAVHRIDALRVKFDGGADQLAEIIACMGQNTFRPRVLAFDYWQFSTLPKITFPRQILASIADNAVEIKLPGLNAELPAPGSFPFLRKLELHLLEVPSGAAEITFFDLHKMLSHMKQLRSLVLQVEAPRYRSIASGSPCVDNVTLPYLHEMALLDSEISSPIHHLARSLRQSPTCTLMIRTSCNGRGSKARAHIMSRFFTNIPFPIDSIKPVSFSFTPNFGGSLHQLEMETNLGRFYLKIHWDGHLGAANETEQVIPVVLSHLCSSLETSSALRTITLDAAYLPLLTRLLDPDVKTDFQLRTRSEAPDATSIALDIPVPNLDRVDLQCLNWFQGPDEHPGWLTRLLLNLVSFSQLFYPDAEIMPRRRKLEQITIISDFEVRIAVLAAESSLRAATNSFDAHVGPDYNTPGL